MSSVRDEFLNRYQGKTRKQAISALYAFDQFITSKYFDNEDNFLAKCKVDVYEQNKYLLLDDMVQFWYESKKAPTTIRSYFGFVRAYLRRHGIKTDTDDVNDYVKFPKIIDENRSPLTKDHIKRIISVSNPKYRALFLFLCSTGMRIGEALECLVSWLDFSLYEQHKLVLINIPAQMTKTQSERFTFMTDQAYQALKPYLDTKLSPTQRIFDLSYGSVAQYIKRVREELDLNETYVSRFHKITIHSFRSYVITILDDKVNPSFREFLVGHKSKYKYYRKTPTDAIILYKQAEPELTIPIEVMSQ